MNRTRPAFLVIRTESTVQALQAAEPSKGTHLEGEEQKAQAKPGALRRSLRSEEGSQGLRNVGILSQGGQNKAVVI